jgi:hypothetical protein
LVNVGFELHLAVQTRDIRWTDGIERTSLGPEVAGVVTTFSLVPAGTHRGRAIVDELLEAKNEGGIENVVWDPGTRSASRGRSSPPDSGGDPSDL